MLTAEARVQTDRPGRYLGRFSRRKPLTVTWHPAEELTAQSPAGGAAGPGGPAR